MSWSFTFKARKDDFIKAMDEAFHAARHGRDTHNPSKPVLSPGGAVVEVEPATVAVPTVNHQTHRILDAHIIGARSAYQNSPDDAKVVIGVASSGHMNDDGTGSHTLQISIGAAS